MKRSRGQDQATQRLLAAATRQADRLIASNAAVEFAAAPADGAAKTPPTFTIHAYGGGLIRPAYRYAPMPVVIDLTGVRAAEPVPVLMDHNPNLVLGQSTAVRIGQDRVDVDGRITGDPDNHDDPCQRVITHARNGFVWRASVGIDESQYEYVDLGEVVTVNGREFAGPCYVLRAGVMKEVSLLSVAADAGTSTSIAAQPGAPPEEMTMDFHDWLKAKGFDPTKLEDAQRETLLKAFKSEQLAAAPAAGAGTGGQSGGPPAARQEPHDQLAHIRAKRERRAQVEARGVQFATEYPDLVEEVDRLLKAAVSQDMTVESFELQLHRLRGERPVADNRLRPPPFRDAEFRARMFEAGLCLAGKLEAIDKHFAAPVLDAAEKEWRHGLGLGELLLNAARAHGFDGLSHRDVGSLLRAAFPTYGGLRAGAPPSTFDISGILSAVANKFIVQYFTAVDQSWRAICAIRTVTDFKTVTSYSLTGDFTYKKLPPGGEIQHGTVGEQAYTNRADTFARMFAIDRRDIINDDLGAFLQINRRLGRGGALALNEAVWPLFMANGSFFTTARKNYATGVGTALGVDSLADAETMFAEMLDPDGKPVAIMPRVLLVPVNLKRLGLQIMQSAELRSTVADAKYPTGNTFQGDFSVVAPPYLSNASITGHSKKKWYLLADPNDLAVIEVAFLNGVERPTVESAQANFDTLGLNIRGYFDFGAGMQEHRAGVAMKGEA